MEMMSIFDGWVLVHLFAFDFNDSSASLTESDTVAIPRAMNSAFAPGFGVRSVHEIATGPTNPAFAYLSYYGRGLRAVQIHCEDPVDMSTCDLVEVGGFLDPFGRNFWSVEIWTHPDTGEEYILGSDMDDGLWIFQTP